MARPGHVWWDMRKSHYRKTAPNGKSFKAGDGPRCPENEAKAQAYADLVLAQSYTSHPVAAPAGDGGTVGAAAAGWVAAVRKKLAAGRLTGETARVYEQHAAHLVAGFGPRPAAGLTAAEVEQWADRPEWSPSTRNNVLGTVMTVLRFVGVRLALKRPPKESRGADTCLDDEHFARVLAALRTPARGCRGDQAELLLFVRESGARPQEAAQLTVEGVDWPNGCTRIDRHKTRHHTGRARVLFFSTAAMAVLAAQRARHGTGLLFRTRGGNAYTRNDIVLNLWRLSKRLGFRVVCYGQRHSFATRMLEGGMPDALVAAALGHKGTAMLHKNYSHVGQNARAIKDAMDRAGGRPAG